MDNIKIEYISRKYIPSFRKAVTSVAKEGKYLATTTGFTLQQTTAYVNYNIRKKNPHIIALDEEKVVGWADIRTKPIREFAHRAELGIGVLVEYRGRGIGSALLKELLKYSRKTDLKKIELDVFSTNTNAIRFYRKAGFAREGVIKKARLYHGRYADMILMAKFL